MFRLLYLTIFKEYTLYSFVVCVVNYIAAGNRTLKHLYMSLYRVILRGVNVE